MGRLLFYNGGQSVTEGMIFNRSNIGIINSDYALSVYPSKTYSDASLTTEASETYPLFSFRASYNSSWNGDLMRFGISTLSETNTTQRCKMQASSNSTHDKTQTSFTDVVADVVMYGEETKSGNKYVVLIITNNDANNSVTVRSFQRSNYTCFGASASDTRGAYNYYLDWAYYLDASEYIVLKPSETKITMLKIGISDLTQ